MIKAICPKCKSLIEIDENNNTTKCPNCNQDIFISSAAKLFTSTVNMYKRKGDINFNEVTDYNKAYKNYQDLYKIVDDNLTILLSYVTSKLYTSTLRHICIKEATDLLLNGSNKIELSSKNILTLADGLDKLKKDSKTILEALRNKADVSSFVYNNYLKAIDEYKYFINAYKEIYNALTNLNTYLKDNIESLDKELNDIEASKLVDVSIKDKSTNEHDFYDLKNKVDNHIFPDHRKVFKIRLALYIGMVVGVILSIVGLSIMNTPITPGVKFSILGIGLLLFIGGYFVAHYLRSKQHNLKY